MTAVTGNGSGAITGSSTFDLTGLGMGTAGGIAFNGFTAADAATVTGAVDFDYATKASEGMTFADATNVAGTGAITNLGSTAFNLTGSTAGTAGGVTFGGFATADTTTVTGAAGFDDSARSSEGMTFAHAASVAGSGSIANVAGSFADDSGTSSASGIAYSGFGAVTGTGGSVTGVAGRFDLGTEVSAASGIDYSGFGVATLAGSGGGATIAGSGRTYTLTGANAGSSGTVGWTSFGNIDDATGTVDFGSSGSLGGSVTAKVLEYGSYGGAVTFDLSDGGGATTGIGGTWSGVTAVTGNGSGAITGSSTFNLTGLGMGTAGGVTFGGFATADATAVTGAAGFDDSARSSEGMTFAHAASVAGSGSIANVAGSFADDSGTSSASGIAYSGFGAVTGTGGSVTGVAGRFDLGTEVSAASGIDYSGFGVATLAGSGGGATIAGSGRTYTLTGANAGSSGTVGWTSFGNIDDATGTVDFGSSGSLGGSVTAKVLEYGSYGGAVTFDLSDGGGATTGIGGTWSSVTAVTGNGSGTITGSNQTYTLTGANAGGNGTVGWTSFGRIADGGTGTIVAANQTWALTGANRGTVTDLSGTFTGIGHLVDTGSGHVLMHSGADGSLSGSLDAGSQGTLDYTGYTTAVNVNLAGSGSTGIGGSVSGIAAIKADSNLDVSGNTGGSLGITVTNPAAVTTLGALGVGDDLSLDVDGAVQQGGGPVTVGGATTIHAGGAVALTSQGNDFVGDVAVAGAGIALVDKNDLAIASLADSANSSVSLIAGGALKLPAGAIDAGGGDLTLVANGGTLAAAGALSGNNIALSGQAGLILAGNVTAGQALTLGSSGGSIRQTGGVITAGSLTGSSAGSTSLDGANRIGMLGGFAADGFSLANAQVLTVAGTINGGSGATSIATTAGALTVYGSVSGGSVALSGQGGLGVNGNVDSGAGSTTLDSGGAINEGSGGVVTAGTLAGGSSGATVLGGANAIASLGNFAANGFSLTNTRALTVTGAVDGGSGAANLATTSGALAVNGSVAGGTVGLTGSGGLAINGGVDSGSGTTTLASGGAISEGGSGVIAAGTLIGNASGAAALNGANRIGSLGGFSANGLSLKNAQALTVAGAVNSGAGATSLATTAGALTVNGNVAGGAVTLNGGGGLAINAGVNSGSGTTMLVSGGAISEGGNGMVTAGVLTGQSAGSTTLDPANMIARLGDFTANGFNLLNGEALTVVGTVNGGSGITLQTTSGGLAIDGTLSAKLVSLQSAGAIDGGASGAIDATTLTGSAAGPTTLGSATQSMGNHVSTLGGFSSPAGFSFTNAQTLTLASVGGSAFTVNAGTAPLYLGVTHGDLLQLGTTWSYDGTGTWSSTGRIGTLGAPIYVTGVGNQMVAEVGMPPAYFYAVDAQGNLLPMIGAPSVNVPTSALTSRAQNGNHGDAYIDPSVVNANYRSFGIVPSGILLPPDQQDCQPGQPGSADCPDND